MADKERIYNVARRVSEDYKAGHDVVVVLSAMGRTTDGLLALARDIYPKASKRELDMLLTCGEQISVSLMSIALQGLGIPAISLNAWQVPVQTDSVYGNARIKKIDAMRIRTELEQRKIVVVTGFQGVNSYDDYTTLGRGGSDTTAVALAAALRADACEIYTDVEGVYTADPRVVLHARKLKEITYDEMLELATLGARVLHNRSVELAKKYGVRLVVRSSLNMAEGTVVKEGAKMEKMLISGVACDRKTARIAVMSVKDEPGTAFRLFHMIAQQNINVDNIVQSVGRDGTKDISFTIAEDDTDEVLRVLEDNTGAVSYDHIDVARDIAKVSVVGAGMMSNPGVAARMFEALYDAGINIRMIFTSEIRISVLVSEKYAERAMNAIHDAFGLGD